MSISRFVKGAKPHRQEPKAKRRDIKEDREEIDKMKKRILSKPMP
jgi:hypothetical protein